MRVRRSLRWLSIGALAAAAFAAWRVWNKRTSAVTGPVEWENAPFPFPPVPRPVTAATPPPTPAPTATIPAPTPTTPAPATPTSAAWVAPVDHACPASHPVKAKLSSGIYHVPGGMNYERTKPDRCYRDPEAADLDGLRPSKM
jgi:hypothetical protein